MKIIHPFYLLQVNVLSWKFIEFKIYFYYKLESEDDVNQDILTF